MEKVKAIKIEDVFDLNPEKIDEDIENGITKLVDSFQKSSYDKLRKHHRDWYIIDRFIDGDHWVVYNKVTNSIQNLPITRGEVRRTQNLIDTQLRAVKNFVTRNTMRAEVHPRYNRTPEQADMGQEIAQYYYDTRNLKSLQNDLLDEGLRHAISYFWVGLGEEEDEKSPPNIEVKVLSSYDVFPDPLASSIEKKDCKYLVVTSKQYIDDIKDNKDYNFLGDRILVPQEKESLSEYKSKLERDRNKQTVETPKELQSATVKDCYFRYRDNEKMRIGLISTASDKVIRVKKLNVTDYPIIKYNPERKADQLIPKSWAYNLISPNKAVDKMCSHIESYILKMLNGKFIAKEGSIVNKITDTQGEIVRWKGTTPPQNVPLQPMPATPFDYMKMNLKFLEDLGGMHPSSLGALQASNLSGRSIEALQAADANNVADPIKNLSTTLTELFKRIFDILSSNTLVETTIERLQGTESKKVSFIGGVPLKESQEAVESYGKKGTFVIRDVDVKIEMVPDLAYTEAGRYDKLLELVQAQALPAEVLLQELRFSNISDIMQKLFKEQKMKAINQASAGQSSVNPIELANMENQTLIQGRDTPQTPPEFAIPEHTKLHQVFIEQQKANGTPEEQMQKLMQHFMLEKNNV